MKFQSFIMKLKEISKDQWKAILDKERHVSFFELPEWYSIWENYFNTKSTAFLIDDHLLLSTIKIDGAKGAVSFYNSSPAGTYSNFRSIRSNVGSEKILELTDLLEIQKMTKVNFIRFSPFCNVAIHDSSKVLVNDFTQYIELSPLEIIDQDWSRNHKRLYQKAISASLSVEKTNEKSDWTAYWNLYASFIKQKARQASSAYKQSLFDNIHKLDLNQRDLWLVKKDKKVIAGRLVFYTNDYAVEWHANSTTEANVLGANQLLIHTIIADAKQRAIDIYDFNPSGGHEGVVSFKEKFGAKKKKVPYFQRFSTKQKMYLLLKKNMNLS